MEKLNKLRKYFLNSQLLKILFLNLKRQLKILLDSVKPKDFADQFWSPINSSILKNTLKKLIMQILLGKLKNLEDLKE